MAKAAAAVPIIINDKPTGHLFPTDCGQWIHDIINEHMLWTEYGAGFDIRTLPDYRYDAHIAIIKGERQRQKKENDNINNK